MSLRKSFFKIEHNINFHFLGEKVFFRGVGYEQ